MSERPSDAAISAALARLNSPAPEPPPEPEPVEEAEVRHLRPVPDVSEFQVINTKTGEAADAADVMVLSAKGAMPFLEYAAQMEAEFETLQHKYIGALSEITKLKTNVDSDARKHELWAMAEALHDWYAIAIGHPGRRFGGNEFYQAQPRLAERGVTEFLQAIAGVAFDPKKSSKPQRNGQYTVYDSWEHLTRNPGNFDSYRARAPKPEDPHEWKRWLIAHVEAQLEERPRDAKATAKHRKQLTRDTPSTRIAGREVSREIADEKADRKAAEEEGLLGRKSGGTEDPRPSGPEQGELSV